MNILDENTKAMLDAGKVAVLDGGYIIVTPETLFQVMQGATLETLGDVDILLVSDFIRSTLKPAFEMTSNPNTFLNHFQFDF